MLLDKIEKSIQDRFKNKQINFKNMIDKKFNSNSLNNGNRILSYTSATAVDGNKEQVKT